MGKVNLGWYICEIGGHVPNCNVTMGAGESHVLQGDLEAGSILHVSDSRECVVCIAWRGWVVMQGTGSVA